jgi:hypothetical protein
MLLDHAFREAIDGLDREPGRGRDQQQAVEMPDIADEAQVVGCCLPEQLQGDQRQHDFGDLLDIEQHRVQRRHRAGHALEHQSAHTVHQQRYRHDEQRGNEETEPRVGEQFLGGH